MYPFHFFHNLTFWLRWHVDGMLSQAYGNLVLAWSYLRVGILNGNETIGAGWPGTGEVI